MISRRTLLSGAMTLGSLGLLAIKPHSAAAEAPPETTKIRLARVPSICRAPQYMTKELLHSEGFTDVNYITVQDTSDFTEAVADRDVDITMQYVGPSIMQVDAGRPIVVLAGIQPGCFELFGTERIRSVRDLKGKTVAVQGFDASAYTFIASMITYVGLDPHKDVTWTTVPRSSYLRRERLTPSLLRLRIRKNSVRGVSVTWWSIA